MANIRVVPVAQQVADSILYSKKAQAAVERIAMKHGFKRAGGGKERGTRTAMIRLMITFCVTHEDEFSEWMSSSEKKEI